VAPDAAKPCDSGLRVSAWLAHRGLDTSNYQQLRYQDRRRFWLGRKSGETDRATKGSWEAIIRVLSMTGTVAEDFARDGMLYGVAQTVDSGPESSKMLYLSKRMD